MMKTPGLRLLFPARGHVLRLTVLVALLAACSDGGATDPGPAGPSPNDPVAGTFVLNSVNTQPVPFPLFVETGFRLDLTASTLALETGGQFVLALTTVETVAGFPSTFQDTTRGTWTQAAGNVSLAVTGGATSPAVWDGRQLTFQLEYEGRFLDVLYRRSP
jgi:hypothetical protein